jgi:diamine N-acetyltransferase
MTIHLKKVDRCNWVACVKLSLHPDQVGNLASNSNTIAEAKFEPHHRLRAIYKDNDVIGMLSFCHEDDPLDLELFWLFRFMIDKEHQGKGYGSNVLALVLEEVRGLGGKRLQTMCKPSNAAAAQAYRSFGFKEIGTLNDGDLHFETLIVS